VSPRFKDHLASRRAIAVYPAITRMIDYDFVEVEHSDANPLRTGPSPDRGGSIERRAPRLRVAAGD
jgi:hypothetical protein